MKRFASAFLFMLIVANVSLLAFQVGVNYRRFDPRQDSLAVSPDHHDDKIDSISRIKLSEDAREYRHQVRKSEACECGGDHIRGQHPEPPLIKATSEEVKP